MPTRPRAPPILPDGANRASPPAVLGSVLLFGRTDRGFSPARTLAAVDAAFARQEPAADVIDALTSALTGHLRHEERDGLPLIGVALTAAEWRGVGRKMARENGLSAGSEMFAWILDGADREHAGATLGQLPPPLRLLYRAVWKPRFEKTPRW